MKGELGLGVQDCSLASAATLLPPLWQNNGINFGLCRQAGNLAAHSACPFHFTCAATSPFHITYSLFSSYSFFFLPFCACVCVCVVWRIAQSLFCSSLEGVRGRSLDAERREAGMWAIRSEQTFPCCASFPEPVRRGLTSFGEWETGCAPPRYPFTRRSLFQGLKQCHEKAVTWGAWRAPG